MASKQHIQMPWQDRLLRTCAYFLSILWIAAAFVPVFWMISSSVKQSWEVNLVPPKWMPEVPSQYEVMLDYSPYLSKIKPSPSQLQTRWKEDLLSAAFIVMDQMVNQHIGAIKIHGVDNGKEFASFELKTSTFVVSRNLWWSATVLQRKYVVKDLPLDSAVDRISSGSLNLNLSAGPTFSLVQATDADAMQANQIVTGAMDSPDIRVAVTRHPNIWRLFDNYVAAWHAPEVAVGPLGFGRWILNSAIIAGAAIVLQWIFSGLGAYALSRMVSPRLRRWLTLYFLATMMLPGALTLIPMYLMMDRLHWINGFQSIIIPSIPNAFVVYLFSGFFDQLPGDVIEASRIDGASELRIFWQIVRPLCGPIFGAVALMVFTPAWNDFFWPYLMLKEQYMWTFPIALYNGLNSMGSATTNYAVNLASGLIAAIPTLIMFTVFQRYMQKGIVWSGIKG